MKRVKRHRPARRLAAATAGLFGPVFALPLFVDPYRWARAFGWKEEPVTDVGLYLARRGRLARDHQVNVRGAR